MFSSVYDRCAQPSVHGGRRGHGGGGSELHPARDHGAGADLPRHLARGDFRAGAEPLVGVLRGVHDEVVRADHPPRSYRLPVGLKHEI